LHQGIAVQRTRGVKNRLDRQAHARQRLGWHARTAQHREAGVTQGVVQGVAAGCADLRVSVKGKKAADVYRG
jgi:hypothetical protein